MSINENSELRDFQLSSEIFNNWLNDLLGTNVYDTLESYWWWLLINTALVVSKLERFSPFLFLAILFPVPPSNFNVSVVKNAK